MDCLLMEEQNYCSKLLQMPESQKKMVEFHFLEFSDRTFQSNLVYTK